MIFERPPQGLTFDQKSAFNFLATQIGTLNRQKDTYDRLDKLSPVESLDKDELNAAIKARTKALGHVKTALEDYNKQFP